jgi:hypothetical protein
MAKIPALEGSFNLPQYLPKTDKMNLIQWVKLREKF